MSTRLELVWPNKDKFLLVPRDADGKPVWVDAAHPAASEVRLADFTDAVGVVNDDDPYGDNLLVTGDSLDALRILAEVPEFRRHYRGKVKLVYIDPPFNTGQTFTHYDDWMEHSTWLSFMRDRLLLIKELLSPDGSVWVHLDDAEQHRMRDLLDEVFGTGNFIATVVWQKSDSPRNSARYLSADQDYMHIYARDADVWRPFRLPRTAAADAIYGNPDSDPRGVWLAGDPYANKPYSLGEYEIHGPTDRRFTPPPGRYWRISEAKFHELNAEGRIYWGPNGSARPSIKRYLTDVSDLVPRTLWTHVDVGSNRSSNREMKDLFPGAVSFATPKPERLLERVLRIAAGPGDIVLDCFGGSGTTAAVALKMGRRWVTCELSPDTVAAFTRPRLEKVTAGRDPGGITQAVNWSGGGGFRTLDIGPTMYDVMDNDLVLLADWATNGRFSRAVAGQLGFEFEDAPPFCGRRGRMRLAVIDGPVGPEEVRDLASRVGDNERVTVVAKVILPDTEETLAKLAPGSRVLKAPRDLVANRRQARRRNADGRPG